MPFLQLFPSRALRACLLLYRASGKPLLLFPGSHTLLVPSASKPAGAVQLHRSLDAHLLPQLGSSMVRVVRGLQQHSREWAPETDPERAGIQQHQLVLPARQSTGPCSLVSLGGRVSTLVGSIYVREYRRLAW